MNAYIALEKYIVKEEKPFGVGVPVAVDEEIAKFESQRKKNVQSYNNWLLINIPGKNFFLDVNKPLSEQSDEIMTIINEHDFITSLFVHEAKILLNSMGEQLEGKNVREESKKIFADFVREKAGLIRSFNTGLDFFNFVNSKCITHDRAKSSSLLYSHGIKGITYKDGLSERYLLFNAKKDIDVLEYRNAEIENSKLIL